MCAPSIPSLFSLLITQLTHKVFWGYALFKFLNIIYCIFRCVVMNSEMCMMLNKVFNQGYKKIGKTVPVVPKKIGT